MGIKYSIEDISDFLQIKPCGSAQCSDDLFEYIAGFLAEAEKRGKNRLLLDHRELEVGIKRTDAYEAALKCFDLLTGRDPFKLAIVTLPERLPLARIYETIGLGRGADVKAFTDRRVAISWIMN